MSAPYAFVVKVGMPLGPAIQTLRAALAAEQMAIVSEVDVQAQFKARLGARTHPQRLLGIFSARLAQALLVQEPEIAALLPWGCGVAETMPGLCSINLQDPRLLVRASGNTHLRAACEEAHAALGRVAQRLDTVARASWAPPMAEPPGADDAWQPPA